MLHTRDATISIDNAFKRAIAPVPVLMQNKEKEEEEKKREWRIA